MPERSFVERHRTKLLWAGGGAVLLVLAGMAYLNLTTPAYACVSLFEPTPGPASPAGTTGPGGSPAPSLQVFVQSDMGRTHVATGSTVEYLSCPPASGRHYIGTNVGPIRTAVYGPNEEVGPQGWIHNLEHGGIVVLYRCPGDACSDAGQAELEALFRDWPASPVCNIPARQLSPVIARFDDMAWPYAVLAWDVVMPLQAFDRQTILEFHAAYADRTNPERLCALPTPTPGPTGTAAPTSSPAASPAESTAASPAPSGAAETAPGASPS
jgi:hypothetical protein